MRTRNSMRIVVIIATLAAVSVAAVAQNQTQGQQNQTQQSQQQPQQQSQQQPQQKKTFWQKIKDATQQGQNTVQNTAQQGQNTVQQGTQQVQQGVQGAQQQVQGAQQQVQQLPGGGSQGNAAFSGGGAGSCGSSCFDAGPFQANVSQMTMSQQGPWHIIRMNVQFHNATDQPLIIAYHDGSMVMVDNNGSTYQGAGGNPGQLQGMGIDRGNQTDSQFVLGPGQTGNAMFSVARARGNESPVGTGYTYNFTIDELQAQNGAMAIPVRQYNLNFPSLSPGTSSAAFPSSGGAPASNVAGAGTGKGAAPGKASYAAGGVAPASTVPVRNAAASGNGTPGTPGVKSQAAGVAGKGPVAGAAVNRTANVTGTAAVRTAAAPVGAPKNAVSNAALKSNVAPAAKPAPGTAAKPIPVKATDKKPAVKQPDPAAANK